eukprot:7345910-Pyramimonas_sp.AAC.1
MLDKLRSGDAEDKHKLKEIGPPAPALELAALESPLKCDVGGALKQEISTCLEQAQPPDEMAEVEVT